MSTTATQCWYGLTSEPAVFRFDGAVIALQVTEMATGSKKPLRRYRRVAIGSALELASMSSSILPGPEARRRAAQNPMTRPCAGKKVSEALASPALIPFQT